MPVCVWVCILCMCTGECPKNRLDPLEVEFQLELSMGVENQRSPQEEQEVLELLNHLTSPLKHFILRHDDIIQVGTTL